MDFLDLEEKLKRAVRVRKQNCMGLKSSLDADKLVANIDNAIDEALEEGHETDEVMNWMRTVEDPEYINLSDLREEFKNKGKKFCFGWCPNLKSQHQLSKEADKYVHEVAEQLKKIRRAHEKAPSKMDFFYFRDKVKRAVRVWKQNCMGLKSSLDADKLVANIDNAIDEALEEGHETDEVMNWMRTVEDPEYINLSDLREEFKNKGKKFCFGWCPNLKSQHQLSKEADKYVHEVAEQLKKIRSAHEEAPSKMNFIDFEEKVKRAVRARKQNCMGLKSSLDTDKLVANIDNAIDEALQEGQETEDVMNWMRSVEDLENGVLSDLREELENKGKMCCFGWCPNLKSQHQLSKEADEYVHEVAELLKKIRRAHEKAPSKMDFYYFRGEVKRAVRVWKQNCMGLKSSLDVDKLADNIDNAIDEALQEGCKTEEVMDWMRRVEDLEYIRSDLREEFENKGNKCCFWWCPNLKSQHKLGKEADEYVHEVAELLKKIRRTHEEALSKTEQKVAAAAVKNFMNFDSRSDVWEEIMVALQSPRISSIGVYGEAGVGKTMLVEEIKRKADQLRLFDDVVMAKVTNNPDMKRIQDDISHDLDLELPDRVTAANRIRSRLTDRKVLVILDDIWARIDLEEVGIPFGNKHKQKLKQPTEKKEEEISSVEEQTRCILLMTSRDSGVLSRDMHAHKIVEVRPLKSKEARELFEKIGGQQAKNLILQHTAENNEKIEGEQRIKEADEIVKDCKQLPIAIATLAIAISIASPEHGLLDLREDAAKDMFDRKAMKECKWIYLSHGDARLAGQLPHRLECPQLTFFHLASKYPNLKISDDFFRGADGLRVLGLTKMHFSSIPSSIARLKNLHTLCLDQSKLGTIPVSIMGNLKNLQVLSLVGCDIEGLPQETKQLAKLKLLDLSDCTKLKVILPGILTGLSQLEELYLGNSFDQWDDIKKHDKRNASLHELTQLKSLTSLEVRIHHINMIPDDLFSIELKRYKICIGDVWHHWGSSFEHSKTLKLKHDGSIRLPSNVEELHLEKLNGVQCVLNELDQNGFQELKCLQVKNIALGIEHLFFNPKKEINSEVLPKLEVLFLHNLKGLQKIFPGQFEKASLEKLRIIAVTGCNRLKNLFSFSVAKQLHNLEEIRVTDCCNIVEIVDDDVEEDANVITAEAADYVIELAARIQCLRLQHLTEFISFSKEKIIRSSSTSLFNKKLVAGDRIWNLTKLIIKGCDQLENLFIESIGDCLKKLEHLEIKECKKMRDIIVGEAGKGRLYIFPSLKQLAIENCPELKGFVEDDRADKTIASTALFHDNVDEGFISLEQLTIENCPQLNGSLFDEEFELPELKIMTISHLENLKIIWENLAVNSLRNLRSLRVTYCQNLSTIFPCNSDIPKKLLESLNELEIIGCSSVKQVFELAQSDTTGQADQAEEHELKFQQLKVITIADCPNMATFASTFSRYQEQETSEPFFSTKFVFPNLERMTVSHLKSSKIISENLAENSFCNLRSLGVSYCQNLSTISPCNSGMIKGLLESLQELEIIGCSSVKEVFELEQSDITRQAEEAEECKLIFQQLKVMTIADCPNMVTFASTFSRVQEQGTSEPFFSTKVEFPNLELLVMEDCHGFKYLMTLSTVQSFSQLKELVIHGCKTIEEVIVTEELTKENRISLFPKLNSMELEDLPELTRFCSEPQNLQATASFVFPNVTNLKFSKLPKLASFLTKNATEWPELTSIHVRECDQVQIFALEFPSGDNQIESRTQQHPLFWVNKGLERQEGSSRSNTIDLNQQGLEGKEGSIRSSTIDINQQGLEGQEGSSRSSTIDMPAVSFMNLRTLNLSRCHGLVTVLRYTMAKRLDQLSKMSITECSKLEEIVACEDNEVEDEIVFTQLTSLRLGLLSRLKSFCSGKCNFSLPSLDEVILSKCPEMSTFSNGVVKTEKLQKVKLTEEDDAGIWKDGDLNSSIQYLFPSKNHPAAEPFKTKTLPHLDEFHGRNVQGVNAVIEDKKKDDGQEKEQNEDDGLDHNENKGENSVSLDDSHPSVAQDAQESAMVNEMK
ncbi:hypothetical protein SLEP1_g48588 [Rubroshorea leprosula]|uniref:AAA+ ATPase domain-containing protein n=1 Tax=Rubroshorea leprosula TaxID=152421 RepID=A0AAV5LWE2_9ROSI|nr:hypothetical protein SLEP1_g48588 [Rubroshorea leprosula]